MCSIFILRNKNILTGNNKMEFIAECEYCYIVKALAEFSMSDGKQLVCNTCIELHKKIQGTFLVDYPLLAREWFFEKNEERGIFPKNYTYGLGKKVWWKCRIKECHVWETSINNRTKPNTNTGCPVCTNKLVCPTDQCNSLYYFASEKLKQEWYGDVEDMKLYTPVVSREVLWKCSVDPHHIWKAVISSRNGNHQSNCPICSN